MSDAARTIVHVPRRFVAEEWGGTETVILEISRQQQQTGWDPRIVTSMALAKQRREMIGGVPVRRFPYVYPFFGLTPANKAAMDKKGGNLLSLSLFASLLAMPKVRLYHAHAIKRLGGEVRTAARLRKKPFVVSLHGGVFDVPAHETAEMRQSIENKVEWGRLFGAAFGSRRVLDDADLVICVGQAEMEKARKELSHDRVTYLPNGVDCAKFAEGDGAAFRHQHGLPADAFVVLNISRLDTQKNQRLLLEAFAKVAALKPQARLVLIGPETNPGYAGQLRAFIAEQGLDRHALILPGMRTEDPDLVRAFHACDVFVLPSRHEPFGIVVLEAWSAGKAVIASRVGGLKGLIRDGETGLLVEADDREGLAARLLELEASPARRFQLGMAGRDEARGAYSWEKIAARLENLYQQAEAHAAQQHGGRRR